MNVCRSSTTMQMDAKYKAVKQSRCMTRVITALASPINKTISSRCDPKPGSLTGTRFSSRLVGKQEVGRDCINEHHPNSPRARVPGRTLAHLKGKDAESEEAQEHANSSSLALYA
jgi:hypothetical protein